MIFLYAAHLLDVTIPDMITVSPYFFNDFLLNLLLLMIPILIGVRIVISVRAQI